MNYLEFQTRKLDFYCITMLLNRAATTHGNVFWHKIYTGLIRCNEKKNLVK